MDREFIYKKKVIKSMQFKINFIYVIVVCTLINSNAFGQSFDKSVENIIKQLQCEELARQQLIEWKVANRIFKKPGIIDNSFIYRMPTQTVGQWILIENKKHGLRMSKVDSTKNESKSWDKDCAVTSQMENYPPKQYVNNEFTDRSLKTLLVQHPVGIVYLWSPHMLLSVEGINELNEITKELGISYDVLLDSNANTSFAKATAIKIGLKKDIFRKNSALELFFRNFSVHSPSLLLYKNGEIIGPIIPGYRSPTHYKQLIRTRLKI